MCKDPSSIIVSPCEQFVLHSTYQCVLILIYSNMYKILSPNWVCYCTVVMISYMYILINDQ